MDAMTVTRAYEDYHDQLYGYLMSLTRASDVAEDLVQETYGRLVREFRSGREPEHMRAWLYEVARNLAISRGRRMQVAERATHEVAAGPTVASPEDHVLLRETRAEVGALLAELDSDDRSALLMAAQGYSGAEIARATGRTEGCVRTRMCRARSRLRARLEAFPVSASV